MRILFLTKSSNQKIAKPLPLAIANGMTRIGIRLSKITAAFPSYTWKCGYFIVIMSSISFSAAIINIQKRKCQIVENQQFGIK